MCNIAHRMDFFIIFSTRSMNWSLIREYLLESHMRYFLYLYNKDSIDSIIVLYISNMVGVDSVYFDVSDTILFYGVIYVSR